MNRRHFIKLFGVSTVAAAVGSQLPAVAAPVPIPVPKVPTVDEMVDLYHQKVVDDVVARIKSGQLHENPYRVTASDLGLMRVRS